MKRKAILIGNTNGLPGVQKDLISLSEYLKSETGGFWRNSEIEIIQNSRKDYLLNKLDAWRGEGYDYVFLAFSGHGAEVNGTILELNKDCEQIDEVSLHRISSRQINLYDCCRVDESVSEKRLLTETLAFTDSAYQDRIREFFNARIMNAVAQQVLLFSCIKGQCATDTQQGGIYTQNLLRAARALAKHGNASINETHELASMLVASEVGSRGLSEQTPEMIAPRCLSQRQLAFGLKIS